MSSTSDITIQPGRERAALTGAWRCFYEDPGMVAQLTEQCVSVGRERQDGRLVARARALSAAVAIHRGDLESAAGFLAEGLQASGADPDARTAADLAAVSAQLAFLNGDYDAATLACQRTIEQADLSDDLEVRIRARRATCMVYGNLQLPECRRLVDELLELAVATDEPWEEALSRNDLACQLLEAGDGAGAEREINRALRLIGPIGWGTTFAAAVVHSTRADVMLALDRPAEGLAAAERSVELLLSVSEPDPYILAATVRAQLQALRTLDRAEEAQAVGIATLERVGDRLPHTRSRLMLQLAEALRKSGFTLDADQTVSAARELQRHESQRSDPGLPPPVADPPRGA